jgi:hypothetical protein
VSRKVKLVPKVCVEHVVLGKSSPPPSTWDEAGKPFDVLLKAIRCPAGPTAIACLEAVPCEGLFSVLSLIRYAL